MPTYDYACTACRHQWELEQSIKDDPISKCPKCGKKTAKRQISSGAGFILKGGGWYADLYSSSGGKGGSKASGGESSSKSETKVETKSETKPEAKPAAKAEPKSKPSKSS